MVVVCQCGRRSRRAAEILTAAGFMVSNLEGGMNKWISDGRLTAAPPFRLWIPYPVR